MLDAIVREYERIIDNGYRALPIFKYALPTAAYGVLAGFDCHVLTEQMIKERSNNSSLSLAQVQILKCLGEGFILAMRWLLGSRDSVDVEPAPSKNLVEVANDLIQYGAKYFRVSMLYSSYSQGKMEATVDPARKLVRFAHKAAFVDKRPSWGFADEASNEMLLKTPQWEEQHERMQEGASEVFRRIPYHLESGRIVLEDVAPLSSKSVRQYVEWATARQRLFSPELDLGGFTIRDFTAFWQAIYAWSVCVTDIYLHCCDRRNLPQETFMPTQVVARDTFIKGVATLSGLFPGVVERILARLKVDHRTSKLDVYLQPFLCGQRLVAWSVRSVQLSVWQRNLMKLMARTPSQKALADQIIASREPTLLASLKSWLETKGWSVRVNQELPGLDKAEIDLIGWNWCYPSEILIVEAKALLQADDSNEVRSATKEMKRAQEQIARIVQLLKQMPSEARKARFPFVDWLRVASWYGIVVTPEGEAGLDFDHLKYPACSFATLRQRLSSADRRSPSSLWRAMVDRSWQAEIRSGRFEYEPIELAGLTFEEPYIVY